jgi:hypothetical protein
MDSASLCSLAGRYNNPIPPRFLATIDFLKTPALASRNVKKGCRENRVRMGILNGFTNSGSGVLLGEYSWGGGRLTEGNSWGSGQPLRELGNVYKEINIFKLKLDKRYVRVRAPRTYT